VIAELHREPAGRFDAALGEETDEDDLLDAVLLSGRSRSVLAKPLHAKAAATITAGASVPPTGCERKENAHA
jgi:hypothetical protein